MGQQCTKTAFDFVYTDQPHCDRRKAILAKYPEVQKLFGPDPLSTGLMVGSVSAVVFTQLYIATIVSEMSWIVYLLVMFIIGTTLNMIIQFSLHETTHHTTFYSAWANRWFGYFTNLPLGVPGYASYQKYHREHHKYQGTKRDPDIPTWLEGLLFNRTLTKAVWLVLMPAWYVFRPLIAMEVPVNRYEVENIIIQFIANYILGYYYGWSSVVYLCLSTFVGMSFNPLGAHAVAEHFEFIEGHETYSYYGPLNYLAYNEGYHMEHHDFPYIPWRKLPELRRIAPEFYDDLPYHNSWPGVWYKYVMDPNLGPFARITRPMGPYGKKKGDSKSRKYLNEEDADQQE